LLHIRILHAYSYETHTVPGADNNGDHISFLTFLGGGGAYISFLGVWVVGRLWALRVLGEGGS
jgi:hypothetical protein